MMMRDLIETPKVSTHLSEGEVYQALEEFKNEKDSVLPLVGVLLVEFLLKKLKVEKEVMLCPHCSIVFDRPTAKAFKASDI